MSEERNTPEPLGFCKVFHPSGLLVSLPVPVTTVEGAWDYQLSFDSISLILNSGFTVNAPGLEAGEQREQIVAVIRGEHTKDGRSTPIVGVYNAASAYKHAYMKVYLNDQEMIEAFEFASGMKLERLPLYDGVGFPEKGHKKIIPVPKPFHLVWKENPKYDETKAEEMKKAEKVYTVAKKVLVRWESDNKPKEATVDEQAKRTAILEGWKKFMNTDPPLTDFNARLPEFGKLPRDCDERAKLWILVQEHAEAAGWLFDKDAKVFLPKDVNQNAEEVPF